MLFHVRFSIADLALRLAYLALDFGQHHHPFVRATWIGVQACLSSHPVTIVKPLHQAAILHLKQMRLTECVLVSLLSRRQVDWKHVTAL